MTKLRVLFNALEGLNAKEIFPKVKSLGIEAVSFFGNLDCEKLPVHFESAAGEFKDVNVNLFHDPTCKNESGWREKLRRDGGRTIAALAHLGLNNYPWMIELNLYGYSWNPQFCRCVHRDKLVEHFNAFYDVAHDVNPDASVTVVPYPHPLMNLNCGARGWKDWWIKYGEKMKFDRVAMDAHMGVWIYALSGKKVYRHLTDSIGFLQKRGYQVSYVEVGYPTTGLKPLVGWYGWGREKDQVSMLDVCYRALSDMGVPYMQICEFIDPATKRLYDSPVIGNEGQIPKFLGFIPVIEEKHWGLLRSDGSEKEACGWVRSITGKDAFETA